MYDGKSISINKVLFLCNLHYIYFLAAIQFIINKVNAIAIKNSLRLSCYSEILVYVIITLYASYTVQFCKHTILSVKIFLIENGYSETENGNTTM